jgi:hypothetical protein
MSGSASPPREQETVPTPRIGKPVAAPILLEKVRTVLAVTPE